MVFLMEHFRCCWTLCINIIQMFAPLHSRILNSHPESRLIKKLPQSQGYLLGGNLIYHIA